MIEWNIANTYFFSAAMSSVVLIGLYFVVIRKN